MSRQDSVTVTTRDGNTLEIATDRDGDVVFALLGRFDFVLSSAVLRDALRTLGINRPPHPVSPFVTGLAATVDRLAARVEAIERQAARPVGAKFRDKDGDVWTACQDGRLRVSSGGTGETFEEVSRLYGPLQRIDATEDLADRVERLEDRLSGVIETHHLWDGS